MSFRSFLREQLDGLKRSGQYRDPSGSELERATLSAARLGRQVINACSNDYLGFLGADPSGPGKAQLGAGASRLVHGTHRAHELLERGLSLWQQTEAALVFTSGYAANVGTLSALANADDLIVSDQLNHASIVDGCRLSRATVRIYPHLDLVAAAGALSGEGFRRKWLVTESYFSMDGNSPDLVRAAQVAAANDAALVVDEAHAVGVFGVSGRGLCAQNRVSPDVLIGGFGKALNAQGGFVVGAEELRTWLWNKARSFMYSTALSPELARLALERIRRVEADDAARERLSALSRDMATLIPPELLPADRHGPIFPILCGSEALAVAVAGTFLDHGVLVQAIRPPTVPAETSRVRLTLNAGLTLEQLREPLDVAVQLIQKARL